MLPKLGSIRQMRTKLGVTQKDLAAMAGVSTSMINQIESGRAAPSYETARRIFEGLSKIEGASSSHSAGEFCSKQIVRIRSSTTLERAVALMREHSISQLPVFEGDVVVGLVTEDGIMRHLDGESRPNLRRSRVDAMMDAPPPIVDHGTPAHALVPLVRLTKCILVSRRSRIVGVITASDALRVL